MKSRRSTGLPFTIPFAIPAYWMPEQALAVFELLDDLRCPILGHCQNWLFDEIPRNRHPDIEHYTTIEESSEQCEIPIPAYWNDDQALAVFELIDDLREKILAHYGTRIYRLIGEDHQPDNSPIEINEEDLPF